MVLGTLQHNDYSKLVLQTLIPFILELAPWGLIHFLIFLDWGLFEGGLFEGGLIRGGRIRGGRIRGGAYSRGVYKIIVEIKKTKLKDLFYFCRDFFMSIKLIITKRRNYCCNSIKR